MQQVTGRDIAVRVAAMSGNFLRWHKAYIEHSCNIKEKLAEHKLTRQQFEVLCFLYGNPEMNTVSAMSAEMLISKGSLSLMLSKLVVGGFLSKSAPEKDDDGRKVYISLTEKSRKIVEDARETMLETTSAIFERMDEEARNKFYSKLLELQQIFASGGIKL